MLVTLINIIIILILIDKGNKLAIGQWVSGIPPGAFLSLTWPFLGVTLAPGMEAKAQEPVGCSGRVLALRSASPSHWAQQPTPRLSQDPASPSLFQTSPECPPRGPHTSEPKTQPPSLEGPS